MTIEMPGNPRLIRLSSQREITIFLIREELKIHKLMNTLYEAGFDSSIGFGFDTLILSLAGFEERTDELYSWYSSLLYKYESDINITDNDDLNEKAFEVYVELMIQRKKV